MIETTFWAIVVFLYGIEREIGPYETYEEAMAAGEEERRRQRHKPLYFEIRKRFEYRD